MPLRHSLIAALSLALATPAVAAPSPAETVMLKTVDAEQARTLSLLGKLVNQNSGSLNLPGVAAVGRMMRAEFEARGFAVEWIDMKAAGRGGHLIARHKGNGRGAKMLLIGHLDTVFEPDSPFQTWTRAGNWGAGPGAADDKGGLVVMVAVFAIFGSLSFMVFKQLGVGLAFAVLLDATLIRGVLLPASMKLLGERNWWLPRGLRWLPAIKHEGAPGPSAA